jgi:hypothetical protein
MLPSLLDKDAAWALKVDDITDGSDDSYSIFEEEEEAQVSDLDTTVHMNDSPVVSRQRVPLPLSSPPSRERKPSLPLPLVLASGSTMGANQTEFADTSEKQQIKDLVKLAQEVLALDADHIAQEITNLEVKLFLDIQVNRLYVTFL